MRPTSFALRSSTTLKQASPELVLQRKVSAAFVERPLRDALRELSDLTGASVIMDARAIDKLKTPVTATFHNDTSLGAALQMLAAMADLKLLVLENGLYVTTPQNAKIIRQELAEMRADARAEARENEPWSWTVPPPAW